MTMKNGFVSAVVMALSLGLGNVACGDAPPAKAPDTSTTTTTAGDKDGDGIPDAADKCPDQKEDGQAPDPKDGCPKT